jgi:hypothetical protein
VDIINFYSFLNESKRQLDASASQRKFKEPMSNDANTKMTGNETI